jgi:hypothetical protein
MTISREEHLSRLSHVGGLPRHAHQGESSAALAAAVAALRQTRGELATEIEGMHRAHAVAKREQAAELASERAAHDAALKVERTAHNERLRQLDELLRGALEAQSKRAPAMARRMTIVEEALK